MKDLTSGSITRNILATFGFMFVSMLFQTLYFLVDLYFVGGWGRRRWRRSAWRAT
jgi:Na+-driven multidrug efflux pump